MTTTLATSAPRPSVFRRFFDWLFSRRGLRALIFCAVALATLIGLFYAVVNWRGRRAWDAYRRDADSRGVIVDFAKLIPPAIPDDQNFAATPFFKPLFDFEPGTQKWRDKEAFERVTKFGSMFLNELPSDEQEKLRPIVSKERQKEMNGDWRRSWRRDQVAIYLMHHLDTNNTVRTTAGFDPGKINSTNAAKGILENLSKFESIMTELREAAKRPSSRFGIHYEEENLAAVLLPQLAVLKNLAQLLSYRASAELALGRTDDALADVLLALRLAQSLDSERTLISYLVRLAMLNLVVQPVWEGLVDCRWSDAQLATLSKAFAKENPFAAMKYALDGERGFGNGLIEFLRRKPREFNSAMDSPESPGQTGGGSAVSLMPSGWFYFEQVEYNKMFDAMLKDAPGAADRQIDPVAYAKNRSELEASFGNLTSVFWRHQIFAKMLLPALSKVPQKTASMEATLAQLQTSLTLERYFIANKAYPEKLSALVPAYLSEEPRDVIKGGPMKYQRTTDGRYLLYSLGWNGIDDGGKRVLVREGGKRLAEADGDWVWSYSAE